MQMLRVNSSTIVAIGYDEQTARMRIQFQQGHSDDFCRVHPQVNAAFMRTYSKGTYYNPVWPCLSAFVSAN